jgi:hypothetical protein
MGFEIGIWAMIGFAFAAYAVVGNDALQTLGTFINSNQKLHWFWLFLFAAFILVFTFYYGWFINDGDPSWGRLANAKKYPVFEPQWYHALPPLALVFLTRFGVPVSTSFMVLTIFATIGGLTSMLQKSLIGYGLAFTVGAFLYVVLSRSLEKFFREHEPGARAPWGLATIMGFVIGFAIYFIPPIITSQLNIDPVSYKLNTCLVFPVVGFIFDLIASMAVIKFKGRLPSALVSLLVAGLVSGVAYWTMPEMAEIDLGFGPIGPLGMVASFGLSFFVILYLVASKISSGKIVYWVMLQWVTTAYLWGIWLIQDFANIFVFLPREITLAEGTTALAVIIVLLAYTFAKKGGPVQRILKSKTAVTDIRSATVIDFTYASLLFFFKEVSDIPMSTTWVFLGLIAGREYAFALTTQLVSFVKTVHMTLGDLSKAYIGLVISIDLARGLPAISKAVSGEIAYGEIWTDMAPTAPTEMFILIANAMLIPVFYFLISKSRLSMYVVGPLFALITWGFFTFPVA